MAKQWVTSAGRTFKTKIYVGLRISNDQLEAFRSVKPPTVHSHKEYAYALGPFRSMEGAEAMVKYGKPYDFEQPTVAEADRLGREGGEPNPAAKRNGRFHIYETSGRGIETLGYMSTLNLAIKAAEKLAEDSRDVDRTFVVHDTKTNDSLGTAKFGLGYRKMLSTYRLDQR